MQIWRICMRAYNWNPFNSEFCVVFTNLHPQVHLQHHLSHLLENRSLCFVDLNIPIWILALVSVCWWWPDVVEGKKIKTLIPVYNSDQWPSYWLWCVWSVKKRSFMSVEIDSSSVYRWNANYIIEFFGVLF